MCNWTPAEWMDSCFTCSVDLDFLMLGFFHFCACSAREPRWVRGELVRARSFLNLHLMVGLPLRIYTCCSLSTEFKLWWCGTAAPPEFDKKKSHWWCQFSSAEQHLFAFLSIQFDGQQHLFAFLYCCKQTILNINVPSIWACLIF